MLVSTSLSVSSGAVSCYHALMVNFICFTNEKFSSYQHLATWGMESGVSRSQNSTISQAVIMYTILVHYLAGRCKSRAILVKVIIFWLFCGCNGKTSTVCYQWTRWSSPSEQGSCSASYSNYQHRLRQASLYSRHIMTSALHHD